MPMHSHVGTHEYVQAFVCANECTCACFCVNLWAQQADWAEAWVPSEEEEEGRRGARKRWRMGALLTTTTLRGCAGEARGGQGWSHIGSPSVGVTPVHRCPPIHPYSCSAPFASTFPSFPSSSPYPSSLAGSIKEKLITAGRGAASRTGPDVLTYEEGGGFCQDTNTNSDNYCNISRLPRCH